MSRANSGRDASFDALPCPLCKRPLEPTQGRHGLVWLCRACRAGAATLPILRQIAPREFVNHLWQAALHDGRPSGLVCPSCAQPFTTFAKGRVAMRPKLEVCVRCFWVWLGPQALHSLSADAPRPLAIEGPEALARRAAPHEPAEARRVLGALTAGVLVRALE
jgi:hypothetical protein